jgi:phage repressor protein C with HTH and peptisase S24 domain
VCKWVERIPNTDPPRLRISSENSRFQPYDAVEHDEATLIGRVVWFARQI